MSTEDNGCQAPSEVKGDASSPAALQAGVGADAAEHVLMDYVNYRGERSTRRVKPSTIFFGSNEWHHEPQWFLEAWDLDKQAFRHFAIKDVIKFSPGTETSEGRLTEASVSAFHAKNIRDQVIEECLSITSSIEAELREEANSLRYEAQAERLSAAEAVERVSDAIRALKEQS